MSCLYLGELVHVRRDGWQARRFRYPLYVACVDLDAPPRLRLLGVDRIAPFQLRSRDYRLGGVPGPDLAARARELLRRRGLPAPARLSLVTQLRVGYLFNPVSFFLGHDAGGALETVIAEVNNTYGGNQCYAVGPPHRLGDGFVFERELVVSPFLTGEARYELRVRAGARLDVQMDVRRPDGERVFLARLTGDRAPLDDRGLARAALRHPLMPLQTIALIYWQALQLHWARVPYRRPGPEHARPR